MTNIFGFTGTREGMQDKQFYALREYLEDSNTTHGKVIGHHGDCIGADAEFHRIIRRLGGGITLHPPDKVQYRAFCDYDVKFPEADYLARDRRIVEFNSVLLAAPKGMKPERRSGTWYTVRYALDYIHKVEINVFWPDGTVTLDYGG